MTPTTLQTFATHYTAAWCSQNPAAVAAAEAALADSGRVVIRSPAPKPWPAS